MRMQSVWHADLNDRVVCGVRGGNQIRVKYGDVIRIYSAINSKCSDC